MRGGDLKFAPGEMVDEFLVWERAHVGAQGVLYRVSGVDPSARLLMKVPRIGGDDGAALVSYETEAMILPALTGSHVPRFIAAGDLRRVPYVVFEQVEGRSLESFVADAPLPRDEVARIGAAVADAVHDLHLQEAVHCDLKPDNVILRPGGEAVLLDFGLAWHARFPDLLAEEKRHSFGSTPYLSPEQLLGVRGDPRSDVFSLGVILYELATGELPFGIPATHREARQRLWDDPDPPRALHKLVTPELQEIILHCLEPRLEKRYQSAAHVALDLRNPAEVPLTDRAIRSRPSGFVGRTRRWWQAKVRPLEPPPQVFKPMERAPVILVAVDTSHADDERHPMIRRATRQVLSLSQDFRLVCVSVIPAPALGATGAESEGALHLEHTVRLRTWTESLGLPGRRLSLHVLVAAYPAAALVDFAKRNNVDLIVLGAPRPGQEMLGWYRSVASGVTANAHCSVHVVRVPQRRGEYHP